MDGFTPIRYAQDVLKHCIMDDEATFTDQARIGLRRIEEDICELKGQALNTFGYGEQVKETESLRSRVQEAVQYLDEIGLAPMEEVSYDDLLEQFKRREEDLAGSTAQMIFM